MIYGAENLSGQLNEWKTFVEANSNFKLKITEIHEAELTEITRWTSYGEPCHIATRENVHYNAIPKDAHIITLLWKLLEGQKTCLCGGAWGGDLGIHGRPYTTVPYNVWWWNESYTHEGFNTHGAQIITHEFQNALRLILKDEYGWVCPINPYAGGCDGMTLAECYKAIFSAIPQSVYDQIGEVVKTGEVVKIPNPLCLWVRFTGVPLIEMLLTDTDTFYEYFDEHPLLTERQKAKAEKNHPSYNKIITELMPIYLSGPYDEILEPIREAIRNKAIEELGRERAIELLVGTDEEGLILSVKKTTRREFFELALKKCPNGFDMRDLPVRCWAHRVDKEEPLGWFIYDDRVECYPEVLCFGKQIDEKGTKGYIEFNIPPYSKCTNPPQDIDCLHFYVKSVGEEERTEANELPKDLCLDGLSQLKSKGTGALFVVDQDTVEVHPQIIVLPMEKTSVFGAIENNGDTPVSVDMWARFGNIDIPPQTTPVIAPHSEIDFELYFITPDVPPGSYPCTFYIGKHGEYISDEFTQRAIRVSDTIIGIYCGYFDVVRPPKEMVAGRTYQITFSITVEWIHGAESIIADVWTVRDVREMFGAMPEDITIVDNRVFPFMEERRIGMSKTPLLTVGSSHRIIHEFTIPQDMSPGTHRFETYFGEWNNYFLLNGIFSGDSFEAEILAPEGIVVIGDSIIPKEIYLTKPSTFRIHIENTSGKATRYRITLAFTGIDVDNEYTFTSDWSEMINPSESTKLGVEVTLLEDAIPGGKDEAIYDIKVILEAL